MRSGHWISILVLSALCSGCGANFNSIHRSLDTSSGKGVLIDAKQRAVFVGQRVDGNNRPQTVVCPEPSPDALSAYAAELAAKSDKIGLGFAGASQESAASIGIRTSGLQALRDQIAYTCLSYMNGIIDHDEYELKSRRLQKHTIAYLAIEQLTGAVKAPAVVLNTGGTAETGRTLVEMDKQIATIDATLAELAKKPAATDANEAADRKAQVERLSATKAAITKALESGQGLLASGTTSSMLLAEGSSTPATGPSNEMVAAVRSIVKDIVMADDVPQLCLSRMASKTKEKDNFQDYCSNLYAQVNTYRAQEILRVEKIFELLKDPRLSLKEQISLLTSMKEGESDDYKIKDADLRAAAIAANNAISAQGKLINNSSFLPGAELFFGKNR
jgi:hypothetical protein